MSTDQPREPPGQPVLRRFEALGIYGGLGLGLLVGVLVSGPHFFEWSVAMSLMVIFGGAVIGAGIGWILAPAVIGSLVSGGGFGGGANSSDGGSGGAGDGGD